MKRQIVDLCVLILGALRMMWREAIFGRKDPVDTSYHLSGL